MNLETPVWQSIDPADGGLPDALDSSLGSDGSTAGCVVLLVTSGIDRRWGADASLTVARGLAVAGRSVLLADASLEDPVLHESIDGVIGEGISDVMLYGASVKRVAKPLDGGVLFASAGTPVADASEVMAHPKWETVIHGFQEAGALLLVHLPADMSGADALLELAAGVVVVAGNASGISAVRGTASERVLAVIGPDAPEASESADETALGSEPEDELEADREFGFGDGGLEVEASPFAEDEESGELEDVPAPATDGAAGDAAFGDREPSSPDYGASGSGDEPTTPAGGAVDDGSIAVDPAAEAMGVGTGPSDKETAPETSLDLEDSGPGKMSGLEELERRRQRGARIRQLVVGGVTALIVGGGGLGSAYFGLINVSGITPPERVRSAVPTPIELPGPTPVTPVITHVLAVDAWRTLETALNTADALRDRLPDLLFFVTLIEVDGSDQYALHAGSAFSAVEADQIKETLAEVLDRIDSATWMVQEAQYSFFFGEYSDAADAAGRVQSLAVLAIPAHTLQVEYPDGTTGLRVYGGAFVDEFQAVVMGRLLRANDLSDVRLIQRRGRLPE